MTRKFISILLACVLLVAMVPFSVVTASADETTDVYSYSVIDETAKTAEITGYSGTSTDIAIPSVIDGYSMIGVGGGSFENHTLLESVTIPDSVRSIAYSGFEGCTSLGSITIPDNVTSIGYYAFEGCTGLKNVYLGKNVSIIDICAFRDCTSLESITIPSSVTSIGYYAFEEIGRAHV